MRTCLFLLAALPLATATPGFAQSRELSVPPAGHQRPDPDRPDWIDAAAEPDATDRRRGRHEVMVVTSGRLPDADSATTSADRTAARRLVNRITGRESAGIVDGMSDEACRRLIDPVVRRSYAGESTIGGQPHYESALMLRFDRRERARLERSINAIRRDQRRGAWIEERRVAPLARRGVTVMMVLGSLAGGMFAAGRWIGRSEGTTR